MRPVTVLAGAAVLIVVGGLVVARWRGPTHPSAGPASTATPAAPAAVAPTPTSVASGEVVCLPARGVEQIVLRTEPSERVAPIATISSSEVRLVRLEARAIDAAHDWIRVRDGARTGWVDGRDVRCPFTPTQAKMIVASDVDRVLAALAARDMKALAAYVHPVKGLRLSPSVDIDPKHSVVLRAAAVATAMADRTSRRWGSEDGSGNPIVSHFDRYFENFVYDRDYRRTATLSFNEFGKASTTRPNIREVYPQAIVVECHVPGTRPESEGLDWATLLLVFEQHDGRWYLTALVHDRWTI